jgi:hypothetical protein
MNRREIFGISALGALGATMLPRTAFAQAKSAKDKIVGVWRLVSIYDEGGDGKHYEPWGAGVQGLTIFTAGGLVSSQIISADRDKGASKNPRIPVGQAIGYFGTYVFDEAAMTNTLHIDRCSFPAWDGIVRVGKVDLLTDDEYRSSAAVVHDPVNGDIIPRSHYRRVA